MKGKSGKGCAYKKGGAVMHKAAKEEMKSENSGTKSAKKVGGEGAKKRLDKFKRGGSVKPASPLSGAMPSGLPAGGKGMSKPDSSND